MIRQRALAWAAVLALVATVPIAPLSPRISAPVAALAQGDSAADAGEPTELAVVALHCAEAPDAEALTSFFTSATPPTRCAPAVGVGIAVTENGAPVPGSPFTTDVAGTLMLPVGLGSAVEVREDPKSLPAGYEPLTQEANGVPYANPVRLDPAVAGAVVLFVNVPATVATELAQGAPAAEAGEPIDLAIVALQCADAPATEALTSFFSSGTPPSGCAPAVGVTVDVTENEKPLSGSPFRTDTAGSLAVRIGLGSAVTIEEDPKSLPSGYEPLTQEANGVPYANPVQLDSAVAGAAVLFVNVPSSVATPLDSDTPAVGADEATALAHDAVPDRTGCDPAYPDGRTCIAPGRPLAEPCSITDQRNFTVLAPDPRRLDADGDGIGCEPSSASGGTIIDGASSNLSTSGGYLRRAAPVRTGDVALAVAASRVGTGDGVRDVPPEGSRGDAWFVHRDRTRAGLWFRASDRRGTGNLAIASNPIFISNGVWAWPDRTHGDDWRWPNRLGNGAWFWPNRISFGNLTVAGSGNGNVTIASNPVFIGSGLWRWPGHTRDDGWFWPDRNRNEDWFRHGRLGKGVWGWPGRIATDSLAVASSGNGSLAVVSNPVFIGNGLWYRPNDFGNDDWFWHRRISVGNITIARRGNGNVAVASNPIFIGRGLWAWPNHRGNDDWRGHGRFGNGNWGWPSTISVGNLIIASSGNGNVAIASNPVFIARGVWHWPGHINNRVLLWPNRSNNGHWRRPNQIGNGVWFWPSTISVGNLTIARSGNGNIAIVSNPIVISSGVWFVPPDRIHDDDWLVDGDRDHGDDRLVRGKATQADRSDVEPLSINGGVAGEAPPSKIDQSDTSEQSTFAVNGGLAVEPAPADSMQPPGDRSMGSPAEPVQMPSDGTVAVPSDDYVESPSDGNVTSPPDAAVQPPPEASAPDPNYVAPDPSSVDPSYVDAGNVDSGSVASDPNIDPGYVAPDPGVDPGYVDPSYVVPEPNYVDGGSDPGYVAPEPNYVEPSIVDPGHVDPGYVDPGYVAPDPGIEPSLSAPEPNYVDPGMDAGYVAPEPSYVDAGNDAPNPGMDAGSSGPDPSNFAPEPSFADPGIDAGYGAPGNADAGNIAPDPGMDVAGTVEAGTVAPDSGGGRSERRRHDRD